MDQAASLRARYIALLKKSLVNDLYIENEARIIYMAATTANAHPINLYVVADIRRDPASLTAVEGAKAVGGTVLIQQLTEGGPVALPALRQVTDLSHTMIGRRRMDNIEACVERILADGVPGDLIETGVWRGGATIFMRGLLAAHGVTDRTVWAADSFEGLPVSTLPQDADLDLSANTMPGLAVSIDTVKALFDRYGLLDQQVRFLKGWFRDTLATAPIARLALLRLDGDLYESTMDALTALYDKVSPGGFIIVDDYHSCPPCRLAVDEFRQSRAIADEMTQIDPQSVFWRRSRGVTVRDAGSLAG
jgi:hypothetical protein